MHNQLLHTFIQPDASNTALIGKQLPHSSFVEFEAFKLKNAELMWVNTSLLADLNCDLSAEEIEKDLLNHYAYVSRDYTKPSDLHLKDKKLFLADRYGSHWESCSGGSSRCGMNGDFQVKGIGRNPLVLANGDYNHSHGKLCLSEAVNEAIWGELCHQHLPYGAVRTLAIIKTNVLVQSDYGLGQDIQQPCALAIREPAVRPAHFERATFFWPEEPYTHLRDEDHIRVKEAVAHISAAFPLEVEDQCLEHDTLGRMIHFSKRIARQIATSRIKGIPHGSLTSSNISIDGRFLDFGTITAVPDFANYVTAAGQGGVWDDHLLIAKWIPQLFFYINKYSTEPLNKAQQDEVISAFLSELERTENIETAKLFGVKEDSSNQEKVGAQIKQKLRQHKETPRAFVGFQGVAFADEVQQIARSIGLKMDQVDLSLRTPEYSQYTITTQCAELARHGKVNKDGVSELIQRYIGKNKAK